MISQNCIFYRISKQCMVFKPNSMSGVGRRPELGSLGAGHLTNARQTNGSDLTLLVMGRVLEIWVFGPALETTYCWSREGLAELAFKKMKKKNIPIQYVFSPFFILGTTYPIYLYLYLQYIHCRTDEEQQHQRRVHIRVVLYFFVI